MASVECRLPLCSKLEVFHELFHTIDFSLRLKWKWHWKRIFQSSRRNWWYFVFEWFRTWHAYETMIVLKESILTKLLFKFLFTCIYYSQNWFSISNLSNSNKIKNIELPVFLFFCYCFACLSVKPQFVVVILSLWSFDIMASIRDLQK